VSASEKLKELEAQKWYVSDPAIRAALPRIVAVVEWAENGCDDGHGAVCCMCDRLLWRDGHGKTCPITALEEALS
jgi:hypothetical protein